MKELKYDLTVESNALLCPNPQEFFSRAYLNEVTPDNFRVLPSIKSATKLANVLFDRLLRPSTCSWEATDSTLDAIDIDVCPLSAMAQLCQFDLEQSFISMQMAQGSNGNFEVASFMSYYWETMAKKLQEEITILRWQGDTDSEDALLELCDGHIKKLVADSDVIKVHGVVITPTNVIAEMSKVVASLPSSVVNSPDVRFYVSSNIAMAYKIATATGNNIAFVTQQLDFTFIGLTIVIDQGLPANTMVCTIKDNLIYAFDGQDDVKNLKAVNLDDTVAEPVIRTRTNLKVGFYHTNGSEIVLYSPLYS
jgi:hypothetical protein